MEPEGSLPCSQKPVNCLYPEPDRSSLCPPPNLSASRRSILILSSQLRLGFPSGFLSSGFRTKALYAQYSYKFRFVIIKPSSGLPTFKNNE
jgi:hypothetical protein